MKGAEKMSTLIKTRGNPQKKIRYSFLRYIQKKWILYLFLLPCIIYVFIFDYMPLYGIQIAFRDFSAIKGIWGSPWVGLKHFIRFFESFQFTTLLDNTLSLSFYQLLAGFPMPIILALLLNYSTMSRFKRFTQTVTYAPHLISTVVMVGMLMVFLSPSGLVNQVIGLFGVKPILFLGESSLFRSIYVWSGIWQDCGWGSVIYLAALANVNQELHEAAIVDGANKIQRIWNIDIVALMPTAVILLVLNLGSIMNIGFEKAFLMQTDLNLGASEIISTYVYKIGILSAQFSYATAIGLFNNIANFLLLVIVNRTARVLTETSLW